MILKLLSPIYFYFSTVTTRKFKITNVAYIHGLHYIFLG